MFVVLERSPVRGAEFGRIALIVLLCLLTAIRFYFKYRAGILRETLFPVADGPFLLACRLVFGIPTGAATALSILQPSPPAPIVFGLPLPLRIAGTLLALACLALLVWVQKTLGANFSTTVALRANHRLVTGGPYRHVRHPMYTAYFLFFFALFLVSGNWLIAAGGMGIILVLMTVRLSREEQLLVERFADAYTTYRERTGAFIPWGARSAALRSAAARRNAERRRSSAPLPGAAPSPYRRNRPATPERYP